MYTHYSACHKAPKCPCIPKETIIKDVELARAYVPFQKYCGVMPPFESLCKGTAFAELFSPYKKREFVNIEPEVCRIAEPKKEDCCYDKR